MFEELCQETENFKSDDTIGQDFPLTQLSGSPSLNRVMCKELFSSCLCDTEADLSQCSPFVYLLWSRLFRNLFSDINL
jgi:hypothetical protein